ncbi:MAG: hypothetical protein HYX63_01175 [Gammaproteobacteria bacterium]|nr:hypothetical protein [Gammaproteobacteria bacterium]
MQYVVVLDLFDGDVVHAVRGQRATYRPLVSPLARSSAPSVVLAGLNKVYPFAYCYVADLNALQASGNCDHEIAALVAQHPALEFWIDGALGGRPLLPAYLAAPNVRAVVGSESLSGVDAYRDLRATLAAHREPVLSLDFMADSALGPASLFTTPALWTSQVIAMNLARVGATDGPDFELIERLQQQTMDSTVVAAGGVRNLEDLLALRARDVKFVLLASALHQQTIRDAELRRAGEP